MDTGTHTLSHGVRAVGAFAGLGLAMMLAGASPAFAQNETALRTFFEGKRVTVKLDMPATVQGVDVRPGTPQPLDAKTYGDRLKATGTAIARGESAMVTLVHVKSDLIEFQLNGGGFGYDSGSVYIATVDKSNREKDLEKLVKTETDAGKRRSLQRELDDLIAVRDRENARIARERARLEQENKARIAVDRLRAGSRFNIRYPKAVPEGTTPRDVMAALAEYLDFSSAPGAPAPPAAAPPPPAAARPDSSSVKKGMLRADVERELGRAIESSDRREGTLTVTTLVFTRADQRISAEFVEGVLFRYSITSK